VIKSKVRIG